jgi:hypothetical protein
MEPLDRPIPIVALAAILAAAACTTTPTPSHATDQSDRSPRESTTSAAQAGDASDYVSREILDEIALTRAAIQARRQAIVTSAMDLTASESQAFWPLYLDYRSDMKSVDDRLVDLIIVYAGNYNSLNDDTADKLLNDYLDIERARLETKTRYVPRFLGVLPAKKVARFYQVDNKLDKKIQAELAAEIPLAR